MRTILATLMALFICGSPTLIYAAEPEVPEGTATEAPGSDAMPPSAEAEPDEAVEGEGEEVPSGGDTVKDFTRHRPGACPEGPPCKMEDED